MAVSSTLTIQNGSQRTSAEDKKNLGERRTRVREKSTRKNTIAKAAAVTVAVAVVVVAVAVAVAVAAVAVVVTIPLCSTHAYSRP